MIIRLFLILTLVPIAELTLVLKLHGWYSAALGPTAALTITLGTMIATGIIGARLARDQGLSVLKRMQESMARGQMPATPLVDAMMVFIGGLLLLAPGYLTDILGLTLLWPVTRAFYRKRLGAWLERQLRSGHVVVTTYGAGHHTTTARPQRPFEQADVVDVAPERLP